MAMAKPPCLPSGLKLLPSCLLQASQPQPMGAKTALPWVSLRPLFPGWQGHVQFEFLPSSQNDPLSVGIFLCLPGRLLAPGAGLSVLMQHSISEACIGSGMKYCVGSEQYYK